MARRKSSRKSEFHLLPNCFSKNALSADKAWRQYLPASNPLTLELGCGKAEFIMEMAHRFPERNFLGVDLKADRLWKPAGIALNQQVDNVAFLCSHILQLEDWIEEGEAQEIWITFPDPFPKKRQAKHRMLNPPFLKLYQKILSPEGKLHFKTDNLDLFHFGLEQMVRFGSISFHHLSFDLHEEEDFPYEPKIKTTYEKKFLEMGKKINYVCASYGISDI